MIIMWSSHVKWNMIIVITFMSYDYHMWQTIWSHMWHFLPCTFLTLSAYLVQQTETVIPVFHNVIYMCLFWIYINITQIFSTVHWFLTLVLSKHTHRKLFKHELKVSRKREICIKNFETALKSPLNCMLHVNTLSEVIKCLQLLIWRTPTQNLYKEAWQKIHCTSLKTFLDNVSLLHLK